MEIVPIVIGLTQLVKQQGVVHKKTLPLVAMAIALAIGGAQMYYPELYGSVLGWIVWGLTASGLYGASKDVLKAK